jgi:hypothetical protein
VHVTAIENSFVATEALPQSLVAFRSGHVLGACWTGASRRCAPW